MMRIGFTALFLCALGVGSPAAEPTRLPHLQKLDESAITLSGLSSGGFFAHQFHIAHSSLVAGVGIVAGGPFACAEQTDTPPLLRFNPFASTIVALGVCTRLNRISFGFGGELPDGPDARLSLEAVRMQHERGTIDNPENLHDDRAWLFWGRADQVVPHATVLALASLYRSLGVQEPELVTDMSTQAAHGLPVDDLTSSTRKLDCLDYEPPYIIDCARDAPGEILRHLLPDDFRHTPSEPRRESLTEFDQTEFFVARDERVSLARTGYAYVPENCSNDSPALVTCRLHIALHGCNQNKDAVGDAFYWGAGYNRSAESNGIVILYPQTVSWTPAWDRSGLAGNPRGCWDWWGYTGADYYNQLGSQMSAVRDMVERLLDR